MTVTTEQDRRVRGSGDELMLTLRGITVRFGGITALNAVSIDARREVLGIIGPNGAGKTTLFDVISGVRAPNDGTRARWPGTTSPRRRARSGPAGACGGPFQRVQAFGWLTVEDNVLAALEWHGGGGGFVADLAYLPTRRSREKERRRRVEEVLEHCGLIAVRKELAGSLPIGVARMVELARAIVDKPKAPARSTSRPPASTTARSSVSASRSRRYATTRECTVLLVEHNAGFVMQQSDRVVVLDLGTVLAQGLPSEVQRNQEVRDAYLGETDNWGGSDSDGVDPGSGRTTFDGGEAL